MSDAHDLIERARHLAACVFKGETKADYERARHNAAVLASAIDRWQQNERNRAALSQEGGADGEEVSRSQTAAPLEQDTQKAAALEIAHSTLRDIGQCVDDLREIYRAGHMSAELDRALSFITTHCLHALQQEGAK